MFLSYGVFFMNKVFLIYDVGNGYLCYSKDEKSAKNSFQFERLLSISHPGESIPLSLTEEEKDQRRNGLQTIFLTKDKDYEFVDSTQDSCHINLKYKDELIHNIAIFSDKPELVDPYWALINPPQEISKIKISSKLKRLYEILQKYINSNAINKHVFSHKKECI